jgi:hypothetical protein
MNFVIPFRILTCTGAANSAAVAGTNVGIPWCKFVTYFAMCLFGIKPSSAIDIDLCSDRFEMQGIAAASRSAEMIEFQTVWNWTDQQLVAHSMAISLFVINRDCAISVNQSSCPQPTFRTWIDTNLVLHALRQSTKIELSHNCPHDIETDVVGANCFKT